MEADDTFKAGDSVKEYLAAMRETFGVLLWLWQEFVNQQARRWIRSMLAWSLLSRLISLMYPFLMGLFIDALINHDAVAFGLSIAGILGTYLFGGLAEWRGGHHIELILGENLVTLDRRVNEMFFSKELGLHFEENNKLTQPNIEKGFNRFHQVQTNILFGGVDAFNTLVITCILLICLSPIAGLIMLVTILVNGWLSLSLNRSIMAAMEPLDAEFRKINRRRNERWEFVERVKTTGQEAREIREMDEHHRKVMLIDRGVWLAYIARTTLRTSINGVGVTATGLYAGYQVWNGHSSMAELVSILTWAGMAGQQMRFLARIEREVNWCAPSLRSLREALTLPNKVTELADAVPLNPDDPIRVEFDNVTHVYARPRSGSSSEPKQVLRGVSFSVEPGQKVALIGPSGSGKSTITRLLQRAMDPESGSIRINGVDLRNIKLSSWKDLLGNIPQRPQIMNGTVRDNLLYGLSAKRREELSDADIWVLMRLLRIDFGSRLTEGLDTRVGRQGLELSGGEAQRVMIGAAAIKRPRFMIIDEATSSLDAEAQAAVQAGLDQVYAGDTSVLVIAHRLSTVLGCDLLVVLRPIDSLENGDLQVEAIASSPAELWKLSPTFRRLAELEGIRIEA